MQESPLHADALHSLPPPHKVFALSSKTPVHFPQPNSVPKNTHERDASFPAEPKEIFLPL